MKPKGNNNSADLFAQLTLESFRLNAALLHEGDRLATPYGLTSARWQVLGTLILAAQPLTVAETARRMGLARQSVQRVADWLVGEKMIRYTTNPAHPRWQQARPTARGRRIYAELETDRLKWAQGITKELNQDRLHAALETLQQITAQLAANESHPGEK
jgi:DNA-binding MarR family transcriptional regulator